MRYIKALFDWLLTLVYGEQIKGVHLGELYKYEYTCTQYDILEIVVMHSDGSFDAVYKKLSGVVFDENNPCNVAVKNIDIKYLNAIGAYKVSEVT